MENTTNLINRSAVKKMALEIAKTNKPALTRVSAEFTERANAALAEWVKQQIETHPNEGKTIR